MKSVDVCGICRDDGATKRLLRKLLSPVDFNSSYSTMLPGIFHCWIEEQAKLFVESFVTVHSSGVIGEFISAIEPKFEPSNPKVEHSNPAEKQQTSNSAEVVSNGLQGLTFGGVQIGVKIKQQKKRMKPSLLNDKPVNNSILGNINSQTIEAQDIRKELKSVIAPMSISKSPITIQTPTTEHVNGIPATVTEITEKAPTCTGSACSLCQAKEDVSAVLRLAAIYSALVKYQHISLTKAISLIQLLTCMDPHKCNDGFIQVCVLDSVPGRRPSPSPPAGALLINASCMRAFVRTLLDQCTPIITNIGTVIGGEVMESAVVRSWAPELAVKMKDILGTNSSVGAPCGLDAQSRSSNFKLPETFLKPFREDIDSKNEYKTQAELSIFYERERAFDELSNLFHRFQVINRSDLDGSALSAFLCNELPRTGAAMLALRDCNYLWFADLFMNLMLFHGCSTSSSPTTSMSTPTPPGNIYTHLNAQSPQQASGDSGVALQSGIKRISLHPSTTGNGQSSSNASAEDSSSSSAQYSAHFPSLSSSSSVNTKSLPLPLPLDVSKQSKLEERLGAGGEVKQVFYSPPSATVRSSNPSTAAGTPATGSSAGSGGYKGKGAPRRPLPSSQQQHSPMYHPHASATSSSSDAYEAPSAHFGGALQFFFRFIVTMNNHRFNHSLLECVLAEVSALLRNDNFAAASSVNFEITSPEKSKGLPISLPSDKTSSSSARRTESNRDFFISPEDFALKVTKLKLLGRFLGLLHFYHHWAETAAAGKDIGPLQKLALRLAEKRSFLRETLPVLRLLQQSRRSRTLSLTVPWACEFLMMMSYDAACLAYVLPSDKQTVAATDTHSEVIPYFDVLAFLHEVQYGPQLQPLGSKLTSNRIFIAMEIQGLWQVMPPSVVGAVKLRIRHASPLQSVASSGAGAHFAEDEATTSATAGGDEEDADLTLDDQHLAFTAPFLRHATPHLEPLYQAWRKCRSEQISSSRHRPALPQVKKKRQTPSVMTTESLALMQALAANTAAPLALPVPPASNLSSFSISSPITGNIAASVDNPVALSVVLPPPPAPHPISAATPTKARRSASASIAPETPPPPIKTAKSPRKPLSSAALTAMNKLDSSANTLKAVKSPSKSISSSAAEHRTRTTSFESLSPGGVQPVASSPPYTPSKFHGERPSPDSATNSITTSGRSSPAGGLFSSKNRQRSLSDLNNPLSLRQPSTSPSPHKFAAGSPAAGLLATPGKLGECGLPGSDSSDILERLEIAFWSDHSTLQEMSNFLLSQTSQACWHHIKELVADGVRELVGSINSLKSDRSNNSRSTHRYEDLLESSMRRVHSDMVKDGEQFIEDYYANFIEKTLPQMCKLYPVNTRVVKMAIFLMNRHFRMQKETFCAHLKGYGFRKLRQLCEASNKRKAQPDGTLGSSGGGGGVTEDGTNSGGGSSSSASRCSPEVLVARQQYCDTHLAAAVGALGHFISFTATSAETAAAEHTPEIFLQEVCTLSFKTDSLFTSVRSGETVVVVDSLHLRNNMSVLLTHLTEISAMLCTLAASHCMELSSPSPPTGNTSAVEASTVLICVPPVDRIAVAGTDCDLRVAFRNLLALYQISVAEISKSVRDERLPLSSTRRAELLGKVAADLAKFTTSILPYLLYLDVVYASLQCCDVSAVVPSEMAPVPVSAPVSALECLTHYSTQSAPVSIQQKPVLFLLPSDLLHHLHSEKIISLEIISRTLGLIARAKTAAFYENCKGLTGMKECVSRALLSVIGRIIFRNQEFLGIDMSVLDDDGWYKDSSIRLLVKSNLSETLSSLISTLLVSL